MLRLRDYRRGDEAPLAALYREAVLRIGSAAYDPPQLQAWAAWAGGDNFRNQLRLGVTLVAICDERVAAFGQLHPADHVALLFTAPEFARRGCATRLYAALEARASAVGTLRLHTEASRISRHFFLKMGFFVVEAESVERSGVHIERFRMEKQIV